MGRAGRTGAAAAGSADAAPPIVAATKVVPPPPGRFTLARPRLSELLDGARRQRLVVVAAPPGWGKTTLLADWCLGHEDEVAWLTLDADDNDPSRFWAHVIESLRRLEPTLGEEARAALRIGGASPRLVALPLLVNDLASSGRELAIVVDDYHLITEPAIHDTVTYLVEHLPAGVQLVLASRSDPPLSLPRLRVRGELAEIRAGELGLTAGETVELLRDGFGVTLATPDVDVLHGKTEGWAAAVHLAALSLRGHTEPGRFVADFGASNRHVVDYLATEVLGGLDPELVEFLLETSILRRLSASLCDAVLAATGSARMLDALVRANVLIEPIGADGTWFRYHPLFADLLRLELDARDPARLSLLHARAASWFESAGSPPEAIHHAALAGDLERAATLVSRHWNDTFNEGQHASVTAWLDALPEDLVAGSSELAMARAWIALDLGEVDAADRWVELAERRGGVDEGTVLVRAVQRFKAGDLARTVDALERLGSDPAGVFEATVSTILRGAVACWREEPTVAVPLLEQALARAVAAGNALGSTYAGGYLALALAGVGRLDEARVAGVEALRIADAQGRKEHFVTMVPLLGLAAAGGRGEPEELLVRAVELGGRGASRIELAHALTELARLQRLRGASRLARESELAATQLIARCPDPGPARPPRRARRPAGDEISERELEVLRLLAAGLSQREVGARLYVSLNTVKTHTRHVFRKLDVGSREAAVGRARERGLL